MTKIEKIEIEYKLLTNITKLKLFKLIKKDKWIN